MKKAIFWALVFGAIVFIAASRSDPTCSESTRLKAADYERWEKSGAKDCKIYESVFGI